MSLDQNQFYVIRNVTFNKTFINGMDLALFSSISMNISQILIIDSYFVKAALI